MVAKYNWDQAIILIILIGIKLIRDVMEAYSREAWIFILGEDNLV